MFKVLKLMFLTVLVVAVVLYVSEAACPNMCSGHGSCGNDDICSCYNNWGNGEDLAYDRGSGGDCSQRFCPFERAWLDAPSSSGVAHALAECAGRGICNRDTGDCECFPGYSGQGCVRADCPNDCSGNGICVPINQLRTLSPVKNGAYLSGFKYVGKNRFTDTYTHELTALWDSGKTMGCMCDPRWEGPDCSKRMCPRSNYNLYNNEVTFPEVQKVAITGATYSNQHFALLFRSRLGEEFITRPLAAFDLAVLQAEYFAGDTLYTMPNTNYNKLEGANIVNQLNPNLFTPDMQYMGISSSTPLNSNPSSSGMSSHTLTGVRSGLLSAFTASNIDLYSNFTSLDVQTALEMLPNSVLRHVEVNLDYIFAATSADAYASTAVPDPLYTDTTGASGIPPNDPATGATATNAAPLSGGTVESSATEAVNLNLYITFAGDQTPGDQFMIECIYDPCGPYQPFPFGSTKYFGAGCYPALLRPLGLATGLTPNAATHLPCVVSNTLDYNHNMGRGPTAASHAAGGVDVPTTGSSVNFNVGSVTTVQSVTSPTIDVSGFTTKVYTSALATSLNLECSGRGKCDYSSGVCDCFEGYTDEACGTQTALI